MVCLTVNLHLGCFQVLATTKLLYTFMYSEHEFINFHFYEINPQKHIAEWFFVQLLSCVQLFAIPWTDFSIPAFLSFTIFWGVCVLSQIWFFATPWTIAPQAPLSMPFSRQEYWNGLPFLPPEDLPSPGIQPESPALASRFFTTEPLGKPLKFAQIHVHWVSNAI